jgi:hypothetical protein
MILGKLRDKNEAPQASAKLQRKNILNNDLGKLGNKSEAPHASTQCSQICPMAW